MAKAKTVEEVSTNKDLVVATEIQPLVLFGDNQESLDILLTKIKKEVSSVVHDISTAKGRKELKATVTKITKSKTTLDGIAKNFNAEQKEMLKKYDKQRKYAFTFLEDLQKKVREPLTEWEDKEKKRVERCENMIKTIIAFGEASENWINSTIGELELLLGKVTETTITGRMQEFEETVITAKNHSIKKIKESIESRTKHDADQKELEENRKALAEIDKRNFEADQKTKAEAGAKQAIIDAETAKKAAELREEETKKQAAIDLEEAEKQKQIEVEAAAQKERDNIEAEKQKEIKEAAEREADVKHRGKINREIVAALVKECKLDEATGREIVKAIAKKKIPNTGIFY